jgi:hypothetical protein
MATRPSGLNLLLVLGLSACAREQAAARESPVPSRQALTSWSETAPLARYHSKRLGVWIGLPDGRSWRIDDHTRPELVATHAASGSRVLVAVLHANEIVGRSQCEELARAAKLVEQRPLWTVEDETAITQGTFDTRIHVALQPASVGGGPLVGHVSAFGGFLRKCYVFDFSTQVAERSDEPALSSRLAFARARILGSLELDSFDTIPARP